MTRAHGPTGAAAQDREASRSVMFTALLWAHGLHVPQQRQVTLGRDAESGRRSQLRELALVLVSVVTGEPAQLSLH